jgi:hypothetical protein
LAEIATSGTMNPLTGIRGMTRLWCRRAIATARAAGATRPILVRGDSAYGNSAVIGACLRAKVHFSVVLAKNKVVNRAIGAIADDAWAPVHYPGAVVDPDTGQLISDAEVAEVRFTAFTLHQALERYEAWDIGSLLELTADLCWMSGLSLKLHAPTI